LFEFEKIEGVIPTKLAQQVIPLIKAGKMDIYFLPDSSDNFADNINVMKQIGKIPTTPNDVKTSCADISAKIPIAFKREIETYHCETREVAGEKAFYLEFEGVIPGTISMQYHIKKSDNIYIMITATSKKSTFTSIEPTFHKVIQTIKMF
jgi:hypothetical protein